MVVVVVVVVVVDAAAAAAAVVTQADTTAEMHTFESLVYLGIVIHFETPFHMKATSACSIVVAAIKNIKH